MVKKKSEEEIETEGNTIDEAEEILDEKSENPDFLDDTQYEEYLDKELARIQKEKDKLKEKELHKNFLKDLPNKIDSLERAIEEIQRAVKILWSEKKR
jgi:molecular chaperone GrpE (heat shock protein)